MVHLMGTLNEPSPWPNATQVDSFVTLHTHMDGRTHKHTHTHTDAEIATIPLRGRLLQIAGPQNTFSAVEFNYPSSAARFAAVFLSASLPLRFSTTSLSLSHLCPPSAAVSLTPSCLSPITIVPLSRPACLPHSLMSLPLCTTSHHL